MKKILGITNIGELTVIACTKDEKMDKKPTVLRITDKEGSVFESSDFDIENFTQCFAEGNSISIVTKTSIPERFLIKDNKVILA